MNISTKGHVNAPTARAYLKLQECVHIFNCHKQNTIQCVTLLFAFFFFSPLVWVPFLANVWLNAYLNGWHWLNGVTKWSRSRVEWNNFRANGAKLTTTTRKYDEQLSSKLLHMCAHELVLFDTIRGTREIN